MGVKYEFEKRISRSTSPADTYKRLYRATYGINTINWKWWILVEKNHLQPPSRNIFQFSQPRNKELNVLRYLCFVLRTFPLAVFLIYWLLYTFTHPHASHQSTLPNGAQGTGAVELQETTSSINRVYVFCKNFFPTAIPFSFLTVHGGSGRLESPLFFMSRLLRMKAHTQQVLYFSPNAVDDRFQTSL